MAKTFEYIGTPPENCNLCNAPIADEFIDANLGKGWADMCPDCFEKSGATLGQGRGQKFRKEGDKFIKVAG